MWRSDTAIESCPTLEPALSCVVLDTERLVVIQAVEAGRVKAARVAAQRLDVIKVDEPGRPRQQPLAPGAATGIAAENNQALAFGEAPPTMLAGDKDGWSGRKTAA